MKEIIYKILGEINPYEDINDDTLLLEEGILDSLTLVLLIEELEGELDIEIPEEQVRPDNFASVRVIQAFLERIGR